MCEECTGLSLKVSVEAFSTCGGPGMDEGDTPRFPYMPHVACYRAPR